MERSRGLLIAGDIATANAVIAFGTIAAILITAAAVVVALAIAVQSRRQQTADRREELQRELRAQADMVIVEFLTFPPDGQFPAGPLYSGLASVSNHSDSPILDVVFEMWNRPPDELEHPISSTTKIMLPNERQYQLNERFERWKETQVLYACRLRWRDRYGNQWVYNHGDDYPSPFHGQPPVPIPD